MSKARRKPWPGEFSNEYYAVLKSARKIARLTRVAWEHGVNNHRNVYLLQKLLPLVASEAINVQNTCKLMQQRKRGRWPYWVNAAVENTCAIAIETERTAKHAASALEKNLWTSMEKGLRATLQAGQKIERELLEGPAPAGEIHSVADEAVLKLFAPSEKEQGKENQNAED
jgi:hypothetical protein